MDTHIDLNKLLKEVEQIKKEHEKDLFMLFDSIPLRVDESLSDDEWYIGLSPSMQRKLLREQCNEQRE